MSARAYGRYDVAMGKYKRWLRTLGVPPGYVLRASDFSYSLQVDVWTTDSQGGSDERVMVTHTYPVPPMVLEAGEDVWESFTFESLCRVARHEVAEWFTTGDGRRPYDPHVDTLPRRPAVQRSSCPMCGATQLERDGTRCAVCRWETRPWTDLPGLRS